MAGIAARLPMSATAGTENFDSLAFVTPTAATAVTVGRTVYLWGAQHERSALLPTSYIPTAPAATYCPRRRYRDDDRHNSRPGTTERRDVRRRVRSARSSGTRAISAADNATDG